MNQSNTRNTRKGFFKKGLCNLWSFIRRIKPAAICHTFLATLGLAFILTFYAAVEISSDVLLRNIAPAIINAFILLSIIIFTLDMGLFLSNRHYRTLFSSWIRPKPVTMTDANPSPKRTKTTDTKSDTTDEIMKRCCIHEAGHVVGALFLGQCPHRVLVTRIPLEGKTEHSWSPLITSCDDLEERIIISYCAAVAEELYYGAYCSGSMGSSASDFQQAESYMRTYLLMSNPSLPKLTNSKEIDEQLPSLSSVLYERSKKLLDGKKELIEDFADILLLEEIIEHDRILQWASKHGITSVQK